jgi:CubicO group peptidase (beta-lactamase class C family)
MPYPAQLSARLYQSVRIKIIAGVALLFLSGNIYAQKKASFLSSTPKKEGVSSVGVDSFLNAAAHASHEFHSFMFLRHGKVIAQGWWDPYKPALKHNMYSTSKSFTSTAIGLAVSEKRLTVNDKVISFFAGMLPDTITPYLAKLTVKDLLTMSVGQATDPTTAIPFGDKNWVKAFLATPIVNEPGSRFLYNSMATFMLSAIVQKVTGQKEFDYLKPRLFDPLGIKGIDWEVNNDGINTGGWGLRLKTEDMAKLGQLYLQKGMWQGKQLLPQSWIAEATTFKIDQAPGVAQSEKDKNDWMQGYCYQFWRCRNNAFRADGAFGQYIIVMPDEDAVLAITSESPDMQGELNLVWKYLLPAMHPGALPVNTAADNRLKSHLNALRLKTAVGKGNAAAHNQSYSFTTNVLHINTMAINADNNTCDVLLKKDSVSYKLHFDAGKWFLGTTDLQGPSLLATAKEDFTFLKPYKIAGSFTWLDRETLQLTLRYIESPHTETFTCHFSGDKLNVDVAYSYNYGKSTLQLKGDEVK